MTSYIYCISNPYLSNIIKVGETSRTISERLKELNNSTTTVCDFKLEYYIKVNTSDRFKIEKEIHNKIVENGYERIKGREFFKCSSDNIKKIFEEYSEIKTELIDNLENTSKNNIETNIIKKFNCNNKKNYKCKKCYKEFNKISHYKDHINRKFPCKPHNQNIVNNSDQLINDNIEDNKCPHCLKNFYQKSNVNTHIEKNCNLLKNKITINEIDKLILQRIEEIFHKINAIK
jgi:predicted nuclease with TOPRIM domain